MKNKRILLICIIAVAVIAALAAIIIPLSLNNKKPPEETQPIEEVKNPEKEEKPLFYKIEKYEELYDTISKNGEYGIGDAVVGLFEYIADSYTIGGLTVDELMELADFDFSFPYTFTSSIYIPTENGEMEAVSEGDNYNGVICDGKYIYSLGETRFYILEVKSDGRIRLITKQDFSSFIDDYYSVSNIYVFGDRLVLEGYGEGEQYRSVTEYSVFDITDRSAPKFMKTLSLSGDFFNSPGYINGKLYATTMESFYFTDEMDKENYESYVPFCGEKGKEELLSESEIYSASDIQFMSAGYANIFEIDLETAQITDRISILSESYGEFLFLENGVYYIGINSEELKTNIAKVDTENGMELSAMCSLEGISAMSESGYFCKDGNIVLPCVTKKANSVYVLDKDLKQIGSIESIYEKDVIFDTIVVDDCIYYRSIKSDSIDMIDLSDPTAPKIVSGVETEGFGEYLNTYDDSRLICLENTNKGHSVRITVLDYSDKTKIKVEGSTDLDIKAPDEYHMAIETPFASPQKKLAGFGTSYEYSFYTYDNGVFTELCKVKKDHFGDYTEIINIGDYLYVCESTRIAVYSVEGGEETSSVALEEENYSDWYLN